MDHIDLYQLHRPDPTALIDEILFDHGHFSHGHFDHGHFGHGHFGHGHGHEAIRLQKQAMVDR